MHVLTRVAGAKRSYREVVSDKKEVASQLKKAARQVKRLANKVDATANRSESLRESRRERNVAVLQAKEAIAERDRLLTKYMARACVYVCVCCVCPVCVHTLILLCVFLFGACAYQGCRCKKVVQRSRL